MRADGVIISSRGDNALDGLPGVMGEAIVTSTTMIAAATPLIEPCDAGSGSSSGSYDNIPNGSQQPTTHPR